MIPIKTLHNLYVIPIWSARYMLRSRQPARSFGCAAAALRRVAASDPDLTNPTRGIRGLPLLRSKPHLPKYAGRVGAVGLYTWTSNMPQTMHPILPIRSILVCWAIFVGHFWRSRYSPGPQRLQGPLPEQKARKLRRVHCRRLSF